ncbi:MAG TPA: B12-binding domain-containing radical SAM protein, partial [Anaerolineaceae bacterium]|nr:B12-binding domain-containing radical SAM protein [Anaerolineaceae bacterium]
MLNPHEIQARLEHILPRVEKPGRYVGGEYNQVIKNWDSVQTHVALAFPDIYDIGVPNLGLAIFYESLNDRPDVLAERVYVPWLDMEAAMRSNEIPLYALESRHAVRDFDVLGITLPYETLFTNTLNLLDLSGIPVISANRSIHDPLVIAGGHATYNPEPMAPFIDAFVIGEGEEVIHEIVDLHQHWKGSGGN